MGRKGKIIVILGILIILGGCSAVSSKGSLMEKNGQKKAEYHKISAEEAHKMMSELNDYILLDVRTEEEYRKKRIEGAVLIPNNEIKERAKTELPDKKAVILVYCQSGGRSANAARELAGLGYTNVYDMGGISGWPYETMNNEQVTVNNEQ